MEPINRLLENNKLWAQKTKERDPNFFENLAEQQTPEFLWIGCSDSRVPADILTGTRPGQIFVQRNIANLVVHTDVNLLSVLEYAVNYLKVDHIIVCGHYNCGGVKAAMSQQNFGIINKWVRNIKDVIRIHWDELNAIQDEQERFNRLVELNVREQVFNLAKTSIIQSAWKNRQGPQLHGWVYGIIDGMVKPILDMTHEDEIDPIYAFNL
ncbi:Carbonate dehydratase [Leadbetterella byssophila DSM 17132]|uniref:Carbonic anhydrase n=1 Tax=Leadbetterella byssophila (strain DSM 17132 / JCM 16389 / KACC 11308 / NBRC 106382 / 4M15) TaxID=649349 RepID=E4RRU6_LEAB4|nr:carbonate dehydratase [Leadbetterella byssophila]ADQ17633.1 Carbonate dehydratase [Leadbetterella byssophila DSM 17132]